MNYYGYAVLREEDLMHYGIKGQKWGVRRFQNADGTRTLAGKTRYGRGKQYFEERGKLWRKEEKRLKAANARKLQAMQNKAYQIAEKYGLDQDDGGGGDTSRYSEATLRRAGKDYMSIWDDIAALEDMYEEQGRAYANSIIQKKYGNAALSDIEHYKRVKGTVALGTVISSCGLLVWLSTKI